MIRRVLFCMMLFMLILSCEEENTPLDKAKKELRIKKLIYTNHYQEYTYDSIGRVSEISTAYKNDTNNKFYFYYSYNQNNALVKIKSMNKTTDMHLYNYTYTDSSLIEIISDYQTNNWVASYKNEYVFGANSECVKKIIFEEDLTTPSFYYKYTWSGENIIKEEEISYNSGLYYTKIFEYDNISNPFYPISLNNRTIPLYHNKNNPIAYIKTSVWGDIYKKATYIYTIKDGYVIEVEFTNEYGEEASYSIEYEELI